MDSRRILCLNLPFHDTSVLIFSFQVKPCERKCRTPSWPSFSINGRFPLHVRGRTGRWGPLWLRAEVVSCQLSFPPALFTLMTPIPTIPFLNFASVINRCRPYCGLKLWFFCTWLEFSFICFQTRSWSGKRITH